MNLLVSAIAAFFRTGKTVGPYTLKTRPEYLKDYNMARITELNNKFALTLNGAVVATYARARDAKRGAARRGLSVA